MTARAAIPLILLCTTACAQDLPGLLEALSHSASNFAATAPGLTADETLEQRGRRGFLEVLKGTIVAPKQLEIRLQEGFRTHRVTSSYGLAETGLAKVLHEIRQVTSVDGNPVTDATEARHALSANMRGEADRTRKILLENFEHEQLEGAVIDFGQLILLFTERNQKNYEFSLRSPLTLAYRQVAGTHGVTVYRERGTERETTEGEIWFSEESLVPERITLNTERHLSKKDVIHTQANVEYKPGRLGLVPAKVVHQQFLNSSLLVENIFQYANWQNSAPEMIP